MTVSDWLKNSHVSMAARHLNGFGAHRSKVTSVNEHATFLTVKTVTVNNNELKFQ